MARLRGLALVALGAVGPVLFVLEMVALVFGVFELVLPIRRVPVTARRLASEWCEVPIDSPYHEKPAPPQPRADGLYESRGHLYDKPTLPARRLRGKWVYTDGATWLDLLWLLLNPVVGTVLGLLAAVIGRPGLRLHGRWTRALLGTRPPWPLWVRDRTMLLIDSTQLGAHAIAGLVVGLVQVATIALSMVNIVPWAMPMTVENSRSFVSVYRRRVGGIDEPYRPAPPSPRPEADGRYRYGRRIFRTSTVPARMARRGWLFRDPATWRDLLWLLVNPLIALPLLALPGTAFLFAVGETSTAISWLWKTPAPWQVITTLPVIVVTMAAATWLRRLHDRWAPVLLGPTRSARLMLRVQRLTETRADAVDTQAAELRRIERDLHDGAQGRLVAMGMAVRTGEKLLDKDPDLARKLIVEVRENTATALTEIRDLVHGIHPPVLAERGLADAIRVVALDCPLDVRVDADLPGRLAPPVESAAYFAVRELLTNAAKHADANQVRVDVRHASHLLRIVVADDGRGGADPSGGSGLSGVRRRLGTFDGELDVCSPPGGPTTVTMEIPCVLTPTEPTRRGSSSRRTSTCSARD